MYFRYFVFISPWKRAGPFIWANLNPLHPRMHDSKFGPVVLEKKVKMWKIYRQTDRQTTNDRWSERLTWAFSSDELKTVIFFRGEEDHEYSNCNRFESLSYRKMALKNSCNLIGLICPWSIIALLASYPMLFAKGVTCNCSCQYPYLTFIFVVVRIFLLYNVFFIILPFTCI